MIRLISSADLDKSKYDACIDRDEYPLIYGYSWYLDALQLDWSALVVDDYQMVWPIAHNKKFMISYAYQPFGIQQLGIFGQGSNLQVNVRELIFALSTKYPYFNLNLNVFNSVPDSLDKRFIIKRNNTVSLALNSSYEQLYANYSSNTVRNIKQFQKKGSSILELNDPHALITLFKNNQGEKFDFIRYGFYEAIEKVMHVMIHKGIGFIHSIYGDYNELIAGVFYIQYKGRITLLFSAVNEEGKEKQAMTGLIDSLIIQYSNKNYLLDFEGSNHEGIARFYLGFGGVLEHYHTLIKPLPWPLSILKR